MRLLLVLLIAGCYFTSFSQEVKDTVLFSYPSGVYKEPIQLTLSNLDSSDILYSLDGTYPKKKYIDPLSINSTTTIRVKNKKTLKGYTRNYVFPKRKLTLPVVCITMKPGDLFDSTYGIYALGPNASKEPPHKGANYHKNWERMAYIEFIDTNNTVGFNQKVGIKIFGQFSSMLPQKSFSIHARKKYGNKKIKYKLFPELKHKKYKSFILRNSGSDYCNTHFRDVMMTSLVKGFNFDVQAYRPCVVYLNGEYWGIYHLREKINEHFLKQHYKINKDSVAILKHRGDVQHYGRINYKSMLSFIKKKDFSEQKHIDSLSKLMDIDNYLDYNIAQVYFNNIDAGGNIRYWRHRKKGSKWRWILFDTDFGFGLRKGNDVDENTLKRFTTKSSEAWPSPSWSTLIIRKLLENDSIKNIYIQKLTHYLNTTFEKENVKGHILGIKNELEEEMPYHFKRWKRSTNKWDSQVELVLDFAERRPDYLFTHLRSKFELDTFYKVGIQYEDKGTVEFDSYLVDTSYSGTYFSSRSYVIKATPGFGYDFSHWSGDLESNKRKETGTISKDIKIKANFKRKGTSRYNKRLYLNEICYKDSLLSDYIELYNSSDSSIDVSGWILMDNRKKKTILPKGTTIGPKSFLTLSRDTSQEDEQTLPGLFNIKVNSLIEVYSEDEKLVDSIQLTSELFDSGYTTIEFVNSIVKEGWQASEENTPNEINKNQLSSEKTNQIIVFAFILLILILIVTATVIYLIRKKRLHSSTE